MKIGRLQIFVSIGLLLFLSACAAPVAEQIQLQSAASTTDENVVEVLGLNELVVLFHVEKGQVALDDVKSCVSDEELSQIYRGNRERLDHVGSENANQTILHECVSMTATGRYTTCYGNSFEEGSLYTEKTVNSGAVIGNVITSPLVAALLILDPVGTSKGVSSAVTDEGINYEQVKRIGNYVNGLLLSEVDAATEDIASVNRLLAKYPGAGFADSPYILAALAGFASDDYAKLNKKSINDLDAFIQKYTQTTSGSALKPTISKLNVRKGPSTKYKVAFTIGRMDTIKHVLESKDGWIKFAGAEKDRKYSGDYWVSRKYLESTSVAIRGASSSKISDLVAQAKKNKMAIIDKNRARKAQQRAAEEAKRKAYLAKKKVELRQQKLAKIKPELDAAIASESMEQIEGFISTYKDDNDAAELISVANAKYKELLFR